MDIVDVPRNTRRDLALAIWPAKNPLFSLDNVIITPHAAYYAEREMQAKEQDR